jgi:hypothetical protein
MAGYMSGTGAIGLATLLALAGCRGDTRESELATEDAAVGTGEGVFPAAEGGATIRVVNLWVDQGAGAAIEVHMDPLTDSDQMLFASVDFGTVTETASIPADTWLWIYRVGTAGSGDRIGSHFVSSEDLEDGAQLTILVSYTRPLRAGGPTSVTEVLQDTGRFVIGSMSTPEVEGALVVAYVAPANRVLGEARESLAFGTPGQGCLPPAPKSPAVGSVGTTTAGGTAAITYDVEPGTRPIAAYRVEDRCEGTPRIGPIEVDVASAGRTYLFAYAATPDDLRLVAVRPPRAR